jgi:uncharacterized protein YutE (UPF0331/DUF86 family)
VPSPGITARLERARRSFERLKRIADMPMEEYLRDEDAQALAERHFYILLEAILDTAAFIAARRGISSGPTYRDVVDPVISAGLIPAG